MREKEASATALLIAKSIVFMSSDSKFRNLVPPLSAEASVWFIEACSNRSKGILHAMKKRWFRSFILIIERLTIPGIILHYVLRKRYLEEVARSSLQAGFNQFVILGAGFDTLALRLHGEFPEVLFVEVDHPATQQLKKLALESRKLPKANMRFLSVDFTRQSLEQTLLSYPEYNPDANTLFMAEGILMYLKAEEVTMLLRFIREHSGRKSRFAFTFMEPQSDGKVNFRNAGKAVDLWLQFRGEIFQWGIKRENLASYLESKGFFLRTIATSETFRHRYLDERAADISLADGEYVCVADLS